MRIIMTAAMLAASCSLAHAQAANVFPAATYNMTGAVAATNGACGFQGGEAITGYLVYPGIGSGKVALGIPLPTSPAVVSIINTFSAAVPAGGLNGWAPVAIFASYTNGVLSQGPFKVKVSFNAVVPVASAAAQASITIAGPQCTETLVVSLLRTGTF